MFRQPLAHAASLLAMHRRYTTMQAGGPLRVRPTWIGWPTTSLGLGHRPFRVVEAARTST